MLAAALAEARAAGLDRLDAQLLLAHVLQRPRSWLLAHDDDALGAPALAAFRAAVQRRAAGEPLAYVVGTKEFHGLLLQVDASVLVPRPDTETLVDWALELLPAQDAPAVVDLGTGSGAIALALKQARPAACVHAVDASAAALATAQANAARLGLGLCFHHGDWWTAVGGRRFHLAVGNPPYIAEGDPHLAALHAEPAMALTSGADGLDAIRRIVAGAPAHLEPGAWLLLEHGLDQADAVARLLRNTGFDAVCSRKDLAGVNRCTGGRWMPARQTQSDATGPTPPRPAA